MTQDERFKIVGRAYVERDAARTSLAILDLELRQMDKALRDSSRRLVDHSVVKTLADEEAVLVNAGEFIRISKEHSDIHDRLLELDIIIGNLGLG